jgi:hypothetical protein
MENELENNLLMFKVDEEKIEAIRDWPKPAGMKALNMVYGECEVGPKRKYERSLLMCPDHLVRQ